MARLEAVTGLGRASIGKSWRARMGRILAVVVLCALALSGAAFAGEPGFTPVEPASPNAEGIKQSYMWVAIFTGAIFVSSRAP